MKQILLFLVMACWVVGAVACPEAGEVERDHAVGRMILWGCAAWVVLWGGWMLWRRCEQKPIGCGWILALLVPIANAVPIGLLNLAQEATDYNDSLLLNVALLGCIFQLLADLAFIIYAIILWQYARIKT